MLEALLFLLNLIRDILFPFQFRFFYSSFSWNNMKIDSCKKGFSFLNIIFDKMKWFFSVTSGTYFSLNTLPVQIEAFTSFLKYGLRIFFFFLFLITLFSFYRTLIKFHSYDKKPIGENCLCYYCSVLINNDFFLFYIWFIYKKKIRFIGVRKQVSK